MKHSVWFGVGFLASVSVGCRCSDEAEPTKPLPSGRARLPSPPISASAAADRSQRVGLADGSRGVGLAEQVAAARRSGAAWKPPSAAERAGYHDWVRAVASAAWSGRLPEALPPAGFVGRVVESGRVWLLLEEATRRRGAGIVAVRLSATTPLIVEAPHSFFEPETLKLALLLFDRLEARALLINTLHRGGDAPKAERTELALSGDSPSDVAHNPEAHFGVAHGALVEVDPSFLVLQLHGFRESRAPGVQVIVSAAETDTEVKPMALALRRLLGNDAVKVYPEEINVLGGTTNVQARSSRASKARFIHMEMAAGLRQRLNREPDFAERWAESIREGALATE